MKNMILFLLISFCSLSLTACGPSKVSKREAFPGMYAEHPVSILVLPPINETTAADAKEYYATTIAEPLSSEGYYVLPIEVTSDILKSEGIYDTELIRRVPPRKFKEYFGADAVLYITIKKWDTRYYIVGGDVTVAVDFLLRSTETGENLWRYDGRVKVDTTGDSGGAGGIEGLVAKLADTAMKTAMTDYVPIAQEANRITMLSLPYGKYHSLSGKDGDVRIVDKRKERK